MPTSLSVWESQTPNPVATESLCSTSEENGEGGGGESENEQEGVGRIDGREGGDGDAKRGGRDIESVVTILQGGP
jgi:hypothetical protein